MLARKQIKIFWIILASQFLLLLGFVFFRLIDFDEGPYLASAYLVREGKLPYVDFFYPQMPYLPYAYALVSSFGFPSIYYARLISLCAGIFLLLLIFWFAQKFFKDEKLSLALLFLYGFNGLTLSWHSVVKTLVFSDLFAFISFMLFASYLSSKEKEPAVGPTPVWAEKLFWAGFFIGMAFNFRLTIILILLIEGVMIFVLPPYPSLKRRIIDATWLVSGAILASSLAIYLFFKAPEAFLFANIGFHKLWGEEMVKMTLFKKLYTFSKFVFSPQNLFILIMGAISLIFWVKKLIREKAPALDDKIVVCALSISLVMVVCSFLMSPTVFQYYEQSLPYLLIASVPVLGRLIYKYKDKMLICRGFSVFYLLSAIPFMVVFIFAIRPQDVPYRIDHVKEVVEAARQNAPPGEIILSGWSGYVILSKGEPVPGMETFGWWAIDLLSPEQIENFRLLDRKSISDLISSQKVNLIIEDEWFLYNFEELIKANYHLVQAPRFAKIYVKRKPED